MEENPRVWFRAMNKWIESYQTKCKSEKSSEEVKEKNENVVIKPIESWEDVMKVLVDSILPFAWHLPPQQWEFLSQCWKPNHER